MGRRATLLTPFDPTVRGNGSSHRAAQWCSALAARFDVDVRVVSVTGPLDDAARRAGAVQWMAPRWRDWIAASAPLPPRADAAPAWRGRELLDAAAPPDVVVAFKMAVAPMAADLAAAAGGVPLVIDLDDDEVALANDVGEDRAALERLQRGVAHLGTVVAPGSVAWCVAAPHDAQQVGLRIGRTVHVVPNVVDVPAPDDSASAVPAADGVLYVANFGYAPNRASIEWLQREVVPRLSGLGHLTIVGPRSESFGGIGFVDDLAPQYAAAQVVLCPVLAGSGTSIKVLEAMAHGRAVVTTTVGARGLDVVSGEHLLIADDPRAFAAHVNDLLADPSRAAALAAAGRALVEERYSTAVGAAAMSALIDTVLPDTVLPDTVLPRD